MMNDLPSRPVENSETQGWPVQQLFSCAICLEEFAVLYMDCCKTDLEVHMHCWEQSKKSKICPSCKGRSSMPLKRQLGTSVDSNSDPLIVPEDLEHRGREAVMLEQLGDASPEIDRSGVANYSLAGQSENNDESARPLENVKSQQEKNHQVLLLFCCLCKEEETIVWLWCCKQHLHKVCMGQLVVKNCPYCRTPLSGQLTQNQVTPGGDEEEEVRLDDFIQIEDGSTDNSEDESSGRNSWW